MTKYELVSREPTGLPEMGSGPNYRQGSLDRRGFAGRRPAGAAVLAVLNSEPAWAAELTPG